MLIKNLQPFNSLLVMGSSIIAALIKKPVVLDISTILIMTSIALFLHVIISIFLCFLVRKYRGIKTFTLGRIVSFCSYSVIFSDIENISVKIAVASCLLLLSSSLICLSIAKFTHRNIKLKYLIAYNVIATCIQFFLVAFRDEFILKTSVQSTFQMIVLGLMIYFLATNSNKGLKESSRFLMTIFFAMQLMLIWRIIELIKDPPPHFLANSTPNALSVVFMFIHTFFVTTGFIMMVCQRLYYDLQLMADTDELTQLLNRRAMLRLLGQEFKAYVSSKKGFAIILLDVDFFKKVNDRYGHDGGDMVLMHIAKIFQNQLQNGACASRWGGEEFLILLPRLDLESSLKTAEYLRAYVEKNPTISGIYITISLGVAVIQDHGDSVEELITAADHALYTAKKSGRNQVQMAH